jgi:urate oxidase
MLKSSNYGKSRIRLAKVERHESLHLFREVTVHIQFSGDYDDCYLNGDNSRILPTDTMKNTVYAMARKEPLGAIEEFGKRLCEHFLARNSDLDSVRIEIEEAQWSRLGQHSFQKGTEVRTTTVVNGKIFHAGIKDLILLNTANSSFAGFIRDEYTTLKETSDRILGTAVEANWRYSQTGLKYDDVWAAVRKRLVDVFIAHTSPSVQSTLYAMGEAVLADFADVDEVCLSLPNKHCLLVNLEPFGMDNPNEVFLPIDEPYGLIEATICR